jgi:hypothetical protein
MISSTRLPIRSNTYVHNSYPTMSTDYTFFFVVFFHFLFFSFGLTTHSKLFYIEELCIYSFKKGSEIEYS